MNTHCDERVCISLGSYGRVTHEQAVQSVFTHTPVDPWFGQLSTAHLQLCPQNRGQLTVETAQALHEDFSNVQWRLHANVHVTDRMQFVDLCDWPMQKAWFAQAAKVSAALHAPAYTAHAGKRSTASINDVLNHTKAIEQLFGIPVGIEGHYPTPNNTWLFSDWAEYRQLLASGVHYAVDLSHLHIVATHTRCIEWALVQELLANPCCLEVHVSGNDGSADQHAPLTEQPWWWSLLSYIHPNAVVFSESRLPR